MRLPLRERWERNPAQGAPFGWDELIGARRIQAFPTIRDLGVLSGENGGGLGLLSAVQRKNLLQDTTGRIALEEGDGFLQSVERAGVDDSDSLS